MSGMASFGPEWSYFVDSFGNGLVAPVHWKPIEVTPDLAPDPPARETKAERLARWSREALSARKPLYRRPVRLRLPDPVRLVRFRPNRIGRALGEAWRVML